VEVVLGHPLEAYAVDLAGRVQRHVVEDDDLLRRPVADALAAEVNEVGGRGPLGSLARVMYARTFSPWTAS
jgi:hypothetical protein